MNPQLLDKPTSSLEERSAILYNVSWERFKALEASLDGIGGFKLFYLLGQVEIVSPISSEHEQCKSTLGLLLEAYMREKGIRFYVGGGFTLEEPGCTSTTPDESYNIGTRQEIPDIAIEVIITSGNLDRRELYKPKKVPEIWFLKKNKLFIYHWRENDYEAVSRSEFFPELDLALLVRYLNHPDQYDAVNEFLTEIRA